MRHTDEARRSRDSPGSRIAVALVRAIVALALVPAMAGAADYSWSGASTPLSANWSTAANWGAGIAPTTGETIGAVTFPAHTGAACSPSPPTEPCRSVNDLTGLTVGSLNVNDAFVSNAGDDLVISGNPITLTGGLSASQGGVASSDTMERSLDLPITLGAPQTWTVAGDPPVPGVIFGAGLALVAPVTGPSQALTIRMSNGASLALSRDNEVGPVTVIGADGGTSGRGSFRNGTVEVAGELNAVDGNPVTVTNAQLEAYGQLGPLTLTGSSLDVGQSLPGAGFATAPAVRLDGRSNVLFTIPGGGFVAGSDYSQLRSTGPVALGGAQLEVRVGSDVVGALCPAPAMGTAYTLVTTNGALTGTFDVPDGNVLTLGGSFSTCPVAIPYALRIDYHESGSPQTVTATVVPAPPPGVRPGVAGAAPVSGTVLVRRPGQTTFRVLKRGALLPAGSELDTTSGRVRLFVATNRQGGTTEAELYSGRFVFRQTGGARPRTEFTLSQPLDGCPRVRARGSVAEASRRRHRHRARHVWVTEDGGSFDTRGQYVGTSVQGTTWLTGDTCTTSVVKVKEGTVTVRDLVRHRTVRLHAGQTYTARKRR
jgi:hypothetical protein